MPKALWFLVAFAFSSMLFDAVFGGDDRAADRPRLSRWAAQAESTAKGHGQRGPHKQQRPPIEDGASLTADASVIAGAANDNCAMATAIAGEGTFSFNSSSNTLDGAPACTAHTSQQIDRDEWFCWTAPQTPCNGQYVVSTCGSLVDTAVAIYQGCNCANTTPLACGDDDCGLQSHVPFTATPGQTYLIRIGTYPETPGGAGSFSITCRPPLPCNQPGANCQAPANLSLVQSSRGNFVVADDFTPTANGNVTSLCWWGSYVDSTEDDCQGTAPDSFEVKYYASNNGSPGALLAAFSQTSATLTVNGPAPTGVQIAGDIAQYEYSATHAPLPVVAGQCYWVEISNGIPGCNWFWEVGINRNQRAFQDGFGPMPGVYEPSEAILDDMAFCLSLGLGTALGCLPPAPTNNDCANATPLTTAGPQFVDLSGATDDGPAHAACLAANQSQIGNDVWYCLTAPCTGEVFVRTCDGSEVDTRIAVYEGCTCPPTSADLLECNDDLCGEFGLQSMVYFDATAGQQYLIRAGTYPGSPGGPVELDITCGPPANPGCPAAGNCCNIGMSAGCNNKRCCEAVCACDPFCCEVAWDVSCATTGVDGIGCGATAICACGATCGDEEAGDCCAPHSNPSCSDSACCDSVCACDDFCCTTEWDTACAGYGFQNDGCGAAVLCEQCIPVCPTGGVIFVTPPTGIVDARRPHPPTSAGAIEGIIEFQVIAPEGASRGCFTMCETATTGSANFIAGVVADGEVYTITLDRPITPGAMSKLRYRSDSAAVTTGTFIAHPGNVNGDASVTTADVIALVSSFGGGTLPHQLASGDIDRSGMRTPIDLLTLLDLLNGGQAFTPWLGTPRPTANTQCP